MTLNQTTATIIALLRTQATAPTVTGNAAILDMHHKRGPAYAVSVFWAGLGRFMRAEIEATARLGSGERESMDGARTAVMGRGWTEDEQAVWIISQDPAELAGWLWAGLDAVGNVATAPD